MIDARLKGVISRLNIDAFVETGTDMGATVAEVSQWFAEFDRSFGKIVDYFGYSRALASTKPIRYPKFGTVEDSRFKIKVVGGGAKKRLPARPHAQIL